MPKFVVTVSAQADIEEDWIVTVDDPDPDPDVLLNKVLSGEAELDCDRVTDNGHTCEYVSHSPCDGDDAPTNGLTVTLALTFDLGVVPEGVQSGAWATTLISDALAETGRVQPTTIRELRDLVNPLVKESN